MKKSAANKKAVLLYSESMHDSQMLYFARVAVPDPFLAIGIGRKKIGIFNALEYNRARKEGAFDVVLSLEALLGQAKETFTRVSAIGIEHVVKLLAQEYGVGEFTVPAHFPLALAEKLKAARVKISVGANPFFSKQMIKSDEEAKLIAKSNAIAAKGIAAAEKALRKAEIGEKKKLFLDGKVLTSERLRSIIEIACLEAGASCECIAAGGNQACDPHNLGRGPLYANELIIIDVFPRSKNTHYFGDMTRTFLKGKASKAQKKLMKDVLAAQKEAILSVKHGVKAAQVHAKAADYLTAKGNPTEVKRGKPMGFIHGLGHGLGLGLHEPIHVSANSKQTLKQGMVFTVEPGLYYPGVGAVRIEDVVQVEKEGAKLLSRYHYRWLIP